VPPSSLIRFAKALGFDGFSDMQRLFRARLVERTPSYGDRLRRSRPDPEGGPPSPSVLLDEFARAGIQALERLRHEMPVERLDRAVDILTDADAIYVVAQRRAFAVASYLGYLLGQLDRRTHLLDSVGGMLEQQARGIGPQDALLAVSYRSYASDVLDLVERCHDRGVPVVAITDGPLSPLAPFARVSLEVVEAEVQAFRSLSASMCLALALAVALGHRLDGTSDRRPIAERTSTR
jgi:DNA-binding MurR/RpiR family transcriptional regulator